MHSGGSNRERRIVADRLRVIENVLLYKYRARCAPGLPTAQHVLAELHWRAAGREKFFFWRALFNLRALRKVKRAAQRTYERAAPAEFSMDSTRSQVKTRVTAARWVVVERQFEIENLKPQRLRGVDFIHVARKSRAIVGR